MSDANAFARRLLIWLVPFAVVVTALGFETDWGRSVGSDSVAPVAAQPQPVAVALLPEYQLDGGLEARRQTVDRVLFNPTRRPAPPPAQTAAASPAMAHGLYTLTGTTVVNNIATAFLREVKGGRSRSVRQGETLNGVLVAEVRSDRVRLKQGDDVEDLQLKIATGPRTTVQPAVITATPNAPGQPPQPGAAAAAAGGTGGANAGRQQSRTVAPSPAPPATPAGAQPRSSGSVSVSELLAERRRAARAAAEAAAGRSPVVPR